MVRSILWSGTVPLLVSPVYGACGSPLTEALRHFGNPPCEPGCWAFDEALGSSLWFHDHREVKATPSPVALICTKPAAVLSAWERFLIHFCPFWDSLTLEKKQPQPRGTQVTSRGRLTGAVARLSVKRCLPSREPCPICVPARRVCKIHFTFLSLRNDSDSAACLKARGGLRGSKVTAQQLASLSFDEPPPAWSRGVHASRGVQKTLVQKKKQLLNAALFHGNSASSVTALWILRPRCACV